MLTHQHANPEKFFHGSVFFIVYCTQDSLNSDNKMDMCKRKKKRQDLEESHCRTSILNPVRLMLLSKKKKCQVKDVD